MSNPNPFSVTVPANVEIHSFATVEASFIQRLTVSCGGEKKAVYQGSGSGKLPLVSGASTFDTVSNTTVELHYQASKDGGSTWFDSTVADPTTEKIPPLVIIQQGSEDFIDHDKNDTEARLVWQT